MYICLYDTYDVNPYGYRSYGDTRPPRPPAVSPVVAKTYEMQLHLITFTYKYINIC
jgi:hypothetical protein